VSHVGGHTRDSDGARDKIKIWQAFLANLDRETAEIYSRAMRIFCEHLGYTLEAAAEGARPDDIVSFAALLKNKGLASGTIRLYLSGVKKFYEACELPYSAMKLRLVAPKKRVEKETFEIPKALAKEIVLTAPSGKRALFHFLWATGVRIGEALVVRKRDVSLGDVPKVVIRTEKTHRPRIVFLPSDLVARLRPRLAKIGDDDLFFSTIHDPRRPLNPNKVGALFRLLLLRSGHLAKDSSGRGYTLSLHSFRRGYETNLARAGVHPMVIKYLLGHSQGVEDHYLRLDEKTLYNEWRKAESLLRLDADAELEDKVKALEEQVKALTRDLVTLARKLGKA
jgi:integrase